MASKVPREQKGAFYARELEAARLRGEWEGDVNLSGGTRLSWSELLRKHMKHNPNDQALPSVANAEQTIRSNLAAWYRQEGFGDASYQEDSADPDGSGITTFPVPLPQDQAGQGWSSQSISEAIQQLSNYRGLAHNNMAKHTIAAIEAYALFAQGQDEATVELLHEVRFLEDVDLEGLKTGKFNEDYTLAVIMMGYTAYGLANERLFVKRGDKGYIPFAYAGYACTIDLHESVRGGKSANALRGLLADEVERWGETSLYRNALLSVRYGNIMTALNSLRAYQAHSGRWPANFRETQRLIILRTYLRLLNLSIERGGYTPPPSNVSASKDDCRSAAYQTSVVAASASRTVIRDFEGERASRHAGGTQSGNNNNISAGVTSNGIGGVSSRTTSTRRPAPFRGIMLQGPSLWSNEFRTVQKAASDTITRSSYFPKAGQVNIPALNLSDEVIRGWQLNGEKGGDWADEVVDLLYLLSRVTFHSQRISRHLFNLLVASENYEEAQKALELYIQIVEKAREGDAAEAGGLVEESRRQEQGHEGPTNGNGAMTKESKKEAEKIHLDSDSDAIYIDTLLYGIHVIAKYLNDAKEADKLTKKVFAFIESNASSIMSKDVMLYAKVKRVAGIAKAALVACENEASTRGSMHDEALSLLKQSLTLDDQSSETYYALAYLQSEMLDVGNAIRSARRAVELEPANVDHWHLLTLLLSSQKDYRGALKIAELGLGEAEDDDEVEIKSSNGTNGLVNGATSSSSPSSGGRVGRPVLLLSMDYPPRGTERAESIVRLMITHNALEEIIEGSQAAIEGQREIFEFFHRRIGASWQAQGPRHKIGGGSAVAMMNGNDGPASIPPRIASKGVPQSTVLGGSQHQHNRFHSLTGLGQSGSSHQLLPIHSSIQQQQQQSLSQDYSSTKGGHVGIPVLSQDEGEQEVGQVITIAQIRFKYHNHQQMNLLASLWLMAAATFRRSGKLNECRTAIQEAERVNPGEAEVWLQLALWFEKQPGHHEKQLQQPHHLAIQSLYKALACKGDHVGATVHLARLFLLNPTNPSIKEVQEAIADVASPLPQTSDYIHPTPLASDLISHTQSRRITASGTDPNSVEKDETKNTLPKDVEEAVRKETEATTERKRLATVSLAEGLLVNITQTNGWNVPEAWLYLGKVMKETNRWEKQRECLEYALQLEKVKSIRSLSLALPRK